MRGSMLLSCLFIFAGLTAQARINVVTLPARDSVQLTIYNSVDLTLVRERRVLTFRKGLNRLEFSWANTLIDPTSVEFRAVTISYSCIGRAETNTVRNRPPSVWPINRYLCRLARIAKW